MSDPNSFIPSLVGLLSDMFDIIGKGEKCLILSAKRARSERSFEAVVEQCNKLLFLDLPEDWSLEYILQDEQYLISDEMGVIQTTIKFRKEL
jgi:hypothetical protein